MFRGPTTTAVDEVHAKLEKAFGKLNENHEKLNEYLADKSYLAGYKVSKLDQRAAELIDAPSKQLEHLHRWYTHIQSYKGHIMLSDGDILQ